jgi:hypothetical protein
MSPLICYTPKKFSPATQAVVNTANAIIATYLADGLKLTLRQLYYRFVAGGHLANTQREYKRLGSIVNDARLAGEIDWEAIEDRGRNVLSWPHWADASTATQEMARRFRTDKWKDQPCRVEVWVEKQALESVVGRGCAEHEVPHLACKGYMSQSELWEAARRFLRHERNGQRPVIIHLGDHDPSGIDMTRDLADRLAVFGVDVVVNRIALNQDQVETYDPPPNPAKQTDSRYETYRAEHGDESWELDALEPAYLVDLIRETVREYVDADEWSTSLDAQEEERSKLEVAAQGMRA